jgi:hypothetical protein
MCVTPLRVVGGGLRRLAGDLLALAVVLAAARALALEALGVLATGIANMVGRERLALDGAANRNLLAVDVAEEGMRLRGGRAVMSNLVKLDGGSVSAINEVAEIGHVCSPSVIRF